MAGLPKNPIWEPLSLVKTKYHEIRFINIESLRYFLRFQIFICKTQVGVIDKQKEIKFFERGLDIIDIQND